MISYPFCKGSVFLPSRKLAIAVWFPCMNIARRASLIDGRAFWCPQCHAYTSLRSGSFFAKSRLPLQKWLLLMYLWVREKMLKKRVKLLTTQQFVCIGGFARCAQPNSCKHQFCWEGLVLMSKLTNHFFGTNLK